MLPLPDAVARTPDVAAQRRDVPAAASPGISHNRHDFFVLQRLAGNRAVCQLAATSIAVQRQRRRAGAAAAVPTPQRYRPTTGIGQFDVVLQDTPPGRPDILRAELRLFFDFVNSRFWTNTQRQAYISNYRHLAHSQWSDRFVLRQIGGRRRHRDPVHVQLYVVPVLANEPRHFDLLIQRPTGSDDDRDNVYPPSPLTSTATPATVFERDSGPLQAVPDARHPRAGSTSTRVIGGPVRIMFSTGSDQLLPVDEGSLRTAAASIQAGQAARIRAFTAPPQNETLAAGGSPPDPEALSLRRAESVRDSMAAANPAAQLEVIPMGVDSAAIYPPSAMRAEVSIVSLEGRRILVHEVGHMIGLGDEYEEPDPAKRGLQFHHRAGDLVEHSDLATRIRHLPPADPARGAQRGPRPRTPTVGTLIGPVHAATDNASIMEAGDEVRARHYVIFVEAVATLTHSTPADWQIEG